MALTVETNQEGADPRNDVPSSHQGSPLLACPTAGHVTQVRVSIHPHIGTKWVLLLIILTLMTMTITGIYLSLLLFLVFAKCFIFLSDLIVISTL